jgi:DNA-binding response OmpR family regulator
MESPSAETRRVLIVDDEPDSVRLLLAYLAEEGLDLMVALNGRDGLAKAIAGLPCLVLLDVSMPGVSGIELCQQLRADSRTSRIPVIFLSAQTSTAEKLQGFAAGGVDFITKPFSADEVLARIRVHLSVHRRLQRLESMVTDSALERLPNGGLHRDEVIFRSTCDLLKSRLAWPPSIAELARAAATQERKLNEVFRRRLGMTVFEYLQELRLDGARRALEASPLQIQQIAESVGYQNAGDFTRAFKRRYGLSPRQYRSARSPEGGAALD